MLFRYFTHAFVDRFARQSVDQFEATVPDHEFAFAFEQTKQTVKRIEKIEVALKRMLADVQRFDIEQRLNIFQYARLAQQLQTCMVDRGYPPQLARDIATKVSRTRIRN